MTRSPRASKTPSPLYTTSLKKILQRLEPNRNENVRAIREDLHDRDPTKTKTVASQRRKTLR